MIISASRRTDIPAHHAEWFLNCLEAREFVVRHPRRPKVARSLVFTPEEVEAIVFWTKNPAPLMAHLHRLSGYRYYFQFTVTPYGPEVEPGLPPKERLLENFRQLAEALGPDRVVWRYDPIFLNDRYDLSFHVRAFEILARRLAGHTRRCVISFLDFYPKIRKNLATLGAQAWTEPLQYAVAERLSILARGFGLSLAACAEPLDFSALGITRSACIDGELVERLTGRPFLLGKDPGQRPLCGCVPGIDVGAYHTCSTGCRYCYAAAYRRPDFGA